jgi:hypothetical protein
VVEALVNIPREARDIALITILLHHRVIYVDLVVPELEFAHVLHPSLHHGGIFIFEDSVEIAICICFTADNLFVIVCGPTIIDKYRKHFYFLVSLVVLEFVVAVLEHFIVVGEGLLHKVC